MRALAFITLCACGKPPAMTLIDVSPARIRAGAFTTLTVRGSGMEPVTSVDADTPTETSVNTTFTVEVVNAQSTTDCPRTNWIDDTELAAQLPFQLAPGTYDVVVIRPDTQRATLPAALTISP